MRKSGACSTHRCSLVMLKVTVSAKKYDKMLSNGIPVDKMATLVWDGPNVNKAIFQKMNSLILQDHPEFPGLVDLGSCVIHVVHNASGKGIEKYGKDVISFVWICMHFSSTVLQDVKISRKCN